MARIIIIIPTYNEKENVRGLVSAIASVIPLCRHEISVLFVDGGSPDGTAQEIMAVAAEHPWVRLITETKKGGLGSAYAKGMQYAMKEQGADYLMEFDADFQHNPNDIPRFINEIDNDYDYIVGSRYISGGGIPKEWSFRRKFLSVAGNLVARALLFIPNLHDITGGFKLSRVKGFMDEFDFQTLLSKSFAYKIHLFFYMVKKGAKVKEVPIQFGHRAEGESKIARNEFLETMRVILMLQYRHLLKGL